MSSLCRWWLSVVSNLPFWVSPKASPRLNPKLVVRGFKGPPEAREALVKRLTGPIKQFYFKAAQNHAAGIVDQLVTSRETADYKLTYQNIMGQEVVTVEVAAGVTGGEEFEKETFPDYAVIDFVIQNHQDSEWFFVAALMSPDIGRDQVDLSHFGQMSTEGVEVDDFQLDYSDGVEQGVWEAPAIIQWADFDDYDGLVNIGKRISSLKVDFTKLPERTTVVVDIYSYVEPIDDSGWEQGEFLGWTHRTDFSTVPPTQYGFSHYVPAPLLDPDNPGELNPACITAEYFWTTVSSVIAGSPTPNSIAFYPTFGGQEIASGGLNQTNADASDWMYAAFAPSEVYYPPEGYVDVLSGIIIYDQIHQIFSDWDVSIDGNHSPAPEPYNSLGYDYYMTNRIRFVENDAFYTKRPVYDEVFVEREIAVTSPCDLVYAFYEPGTILYDNLIDDYEGYPQCAIWSREPGVVPTERVRYKTIEVSSDNREGPVTDDNPFGYGYLGRLTVDRATRSIGWKPA